MTRSIPRVLVLSSLWPNPEQPNFGIFVRNRLERVQETGGADLTIVAPVVWFPFPHAVFGRYGAMARVPRREQQGELTVYHPRYPLIPRVSENIQPKLYHWGVKPLLTRLFREKGGFDLIDAQYFYPDAVAARQFSLDFRVPFVATARGTDVNFIPNNPGPRAQIREAAKAAAATVAVSQALRQSLIKIGAPESRALTLRNGVDLQIFKPVKDRAPFRSLIGVPEKARLVVSVGALIERKGHHLTIEAMAKLPDLYLAIAGEGPERQALTEQIERLGLKARVRLLGALPYARIPQLFGVADVSVLASSREGWANVLLESMACGTPVIATAVYGAPEVVTRAAAGRLVKERSAKAIAAALEAHFKQSHSRIETRLHAEKFGWQETIDGVLDLYHQHALHHSSHQS
ncbi:MAG: glycosyltransferase [Neomegalonema sp.]|nr:glycosyltransferase [Neomegalonema sp.]